VSETHDEPLDDPGHPEGLGPVDGLTTEPERRDLPPWLFRALLGVGALAFITSWIGDAVWADWQESHPLGLMALNARDRYLLLTVNQVERWEFFLVAGLRSILFDPVFYLLGWFYGDRALAWLKQRSSGVKDAVENFEEVFPWLGYPLLIFFPGVHIYVLAGVTRMNPFGFAGVTLLGTALRLGVIVWVGDAFSSQIASTNGFFSRFRWPFIALSVLSVLYIAGKEYKNSRALRHGE